MGDTCILSFYSLRFNPGSSYRLYKSTPESNILEGGYKVLPGNYTCDVQSESKMRNFETVQEGFEKVQYPGPYIETIKDSPPKFYFFMRAHTLTQLDSTSCLLVVELKNKWKISLVLR